MDAGPEVEAALMFRVLRMGARQHGVGRVEVVLFQVTVEEQPGRVFRRGSGWRAAARQEPDRPRFRLCSAAGRFTGVTLLLPGGSSVLGKSLDIDYHFSSFNKSANPSFDTVVSQHVACPINKIFHYSSPCRLIIAPLRSHIRQAAVLQ